MPDATVAPDANRAWQQAMTGLSNRPAPYLRQTNVYNGPAQGVGQASPYVSTNKNNGVTNNILTTTSSNWSGTAVYNAGNPFKTATIIGMFVVPTAHQAFGSCTGGWDYSSQWPGIDGYSSATSYRLVWKSMPIAAVAQPQVTTRRGSNGTRMPRHGSASPAIHPGDLIYIEVWNVSPTLGYAYFYNYSTLQSAEYNLTAPSGTTLVGNSVEWIVERPGVNGGLATLTNYINVPGSYGTAWNNTAKSPTYYWQGGNPAAGTLYDISMLDNSNKGISSAVIENTDFLWFQDYGSACGSVNGSNVGAPPC